MFALTKPSTDQIQKFITTQSKQPFSYVEVGASRDMPPPGYVVDHNRIQLGTGQAVFERAKTAMQRWEMFHFDWLQLCWPNTPLQVGAIVAVLVRGLGIWSVNVCRIVYLIDEAGLIEKFGFAYGTLPEHAERGEERFCLEWHHADNAVWYDILAFSQPNQWPARLLYPYTRQLQKRFAVASKGAMIRAVSQEESPQGL